MTKTDMKAYSQLLAHTRLSGSLYMCVGDTVVSTLTRAFPAGVTGLSPLR